MSDSMKEEIEEIFSEIKKFEAKISASDSDTEKSFRNRISSKILFYLVLGPLVASIIIFFILYLLNVQKIYILSPLILITIGYTGIIVSQIAYFIEEWKDMKLFFTNPVQIIFEKIYKESLYDIDLYEVIKNKSTFSLVHAKEHIENERIHFERRIGVLVGALEKIGLIPGLATLYFAWSKIEEFDHFNIQTGTAIGVFFLYIIATYCHLQIGKLDRYIKTFNAAIELSSTPKQL